MKLQKYLKGNVLNPYIQEWGNLWRERIQPSASSKVLLKWNATGRKPKPETSQERTNRRIKEETKRTWRSDAADIAHGIGEGVLALNPYTAIPYYGAKVGQDVLSGNVGWQTAVNASIPLFHLSPQIKIPIKANKNIIDLQAKVSDLVNNNMYITEDIVNGTKDGFKDTYKYYSSDNYIKHLKSTGLSESEARELLNLKLNNLLDIRINWNHNDPASYGHSTTTTEGVITTELNPKVANSYDLARETMWHESGGHGALRNFEKKHIPIIQSSEKLRNIYSNPWYRKVSEHNSELIPELKPVWKAFMKGDMELFNKLATKEDLDVINKYRDPKAFIDYLINEQEASARAISANVGDFVGKPTEWNLPQLEQFFTKDGIKKLRENVWSAGSLFGGGIAFGNYDYNPEYKEQGGKMSNIVQKFKEQYKKGGSIYIKPSKRGSFTKYCNGKVTNECIARGKRSPSAAIRKKAVFALNSRRWSK